jgi:RNA polymerase sigma-70 factor, ECF subfamily
VLRELATVPAEPSTKSACSMSDGELGQALIDGQPGAVSAVWQRYSPMVRGMLRRSLGADSELEDAVQDVFISLFRSARGLRDCTAVRAFLISITRHTSHRERRRRTRRRHLAAAYAFAALRQPAVGDTPAGGYAVIKLSALLQGLSEQERASFVLRFAHGLTVPEVAEALGVSEPTAKRRLSRARASLSAWTSNNFVLRDYLRGASNDAVSAMRP